jgi:hypothetical protein
MTNLGLFFADLKINSSHLPIEQGGGAATFETSEMRKLILTLSLAKPTLKAEAILKNCQLYTYGDIHYIL